MSQYVNFKLKDTERFTVNKVFGFKWELWIEAEKRYVREDRWFEGAKKKYNLGVSVNGEQGYLSVSANQFANMLEAYHRDGQSNIIGQTFNVKTNGKEGIDIRYYINPEYNRPDANDYSTTHDSSGSMGGNQLTPSGYQQQENVPLPQEPPQEVRVEDIPFN